VRTRATGETLRAGAGTSPVAGASHPSVVSAPSAQSMPFTLARSVNQLVARALDHEVSPGRWDSGFIGQPAAIETVGDLASLIEHVGLQGELKYLRRTLGREQFETLVEGGAETLVLLAEHAHHKLEALVVMGHEGKRFTVVPVTPDRPGDEQEFTMDELWARLASRTAYALVPVSSTPIVSRTTPHDHHDDHGDAGHAHVHEHLTPLERLWRLLREEKSDITLTYLYAVLVGLFSLTVPLSVQFLTQLVQGGLLLQPVVLMITFAVLGTLATGLIGLLQEQVVEQIQMRIFARFAFEFGDLVPRVPFDTAMSVNLPGQMNRFMETPAIQKSMSKLLIDIPTASLQVLFGMVLLSFYNPWFIAFAAVLVLGVYLIFRVTAPSGLETSIMESKYKYEVLGWLQTMARAESAFKFAARSALPLEKADGLVSSYLKYRRKHFKVLLTQYGAMVVFKTLLTGALLILGTTLVVQRSLTLGQFVAAELVIVTVLAGVEKLIRSLATIYDVLTSLDKIGHVTDLPTETMQGLQFAHRTDGFALTLREVSYTYPDAPGPSIHGITLDIAAGERIGITGVDGSGQTTLLRVAGGLFGDYHGLITFDGITLHNLNRAALRDDIGQVLSTTDLFDGTIEENISVGRRHVDRTAVLQALRDVGVADVVQSLAQGVQTRIVNGGANLSAAVASKLLVAQGVAGAPRLLLLDDFFATLDEDYRADLVELLMSRERTWTLLAVSHDPFFLAACDRIVVMRGGTIERTGTWAELAPVLGQAGVHGLAVPTPPAVPAD
jgi:ABC-type bacteriocin/lantibiotic exporter with double-glycine peptidase domain